MRTPATTSATGAAAALATVLLALAPVGCGDPPLESSEKSADVGSSGTDDGGVTADAADAADAADGQSGEDSASTADTGTTDAGPDDAGVGDSGAGDSGSADSGPSDAGSADSGGADGGSGDAGPTVDPCPGCAFDKQPTGDHPGAKGQTSLLAPKKIAYKTGITNGDKVMRVWVPLKAGSFPVLFFVHGKQLYETGGFGKSEIGHAYKALLEHVASRGYIVAFVRVENGLLDCDHTAMAQRLVDASAVLFDKVSKADKDRVMYAGHSMGAKIALLATRRTINQDPKNEWPDPQAVMLFNLDNSKPPACLAKFADVKQAASELLKDEKVRISFVHTRGDKVAVYTDKTKGALPVYEALKIKHKQFIVLHGTGQGDKNPTTKPELHDDHAAPLTVNGKTGGIADAAIPVSHLDALDWYGYWKLLVGALDFHYSKGDAKWAYGAMRTHGGTAPGGAIIKHEVLKQGW